MAFVTISAPSALRGRAAIAVLVLLSMGGRAAAQATRAPTAIDATVRRAVVDTIAAEVARLYVDADTGRLIGGHIRQRAASGAYNAVTDPAQFSEMLSADLRSINQDKHMSVQFDPQAKAPQVGADGIHLRGDTGAPPPEVGAAERRQHYGIGRLDVLPGNVGYLDLRKFAESPAAHGAAVDALKYLETTDAIIIDLRRNGGGSGEMSNFLISHFTGSDSVLSLRIVNRSGNETIDRWTLATVPGPRRPDVPLYLLVSGGTASAAEDFAFVLHNMGRATLVGSRTAGAGHNVAFVDAGHGFVAGISFTRVSDPRSGREWERTGIEPDIATDADRALEVAQASAVARLAGQASGRDRDVLSLLQEYLDARQRPHFVPAKTLARYAGTYEGPRVVTVVDGRLVYWRGQGFLPDTLAALSDSVFSRGNASLTFGHDASGVPSLRITVAAGESLVVRRLDAHPASTARH